MNQQVDQDLYISHGVINYLYGGFQGRFAQINILLQCNHPTAKTTDIDDCQEILNRIREWTAALYRGEALISSRWLKPETFDAMRSVDLLKQLRTECADLAERCSNIISSPHLAQQPMDVQELVAFFGRFCYSRDNYVRGFIDFGNAIGKQEIVDQYSPLIADTSSEIATAHAFFETAKNPASWNQPFLDALLDRCHVLPAVFRSYVHDTIQLSSPFEGGMSYQLAGFAPSEAEEWTKAGFSPIQAGYWRAYRFTAAEAVEWLQVGLPEAALAGPWRSEGFTPSLAAPWIQSGFFPRPARSWADAEIPPAEAVRLIEKGIKDPSEVP